MEASGVCFPLATYLTKICLIFLGWGEEKSLPEVWCAKQSTSPAPAKMLSTSTQEPKGLGGGGGGR